jgi:hypothetical protein
VPQGAFVRAIVSRDELRGLVGRDTGLVHVRERSESRWNEFRPIAEDAVEPAIAHMDARHMPALEVYVRPRTKKALKEAVVQSPDEVFVEETSLFGDQFEGWLNEAPEGRYYVVGPDPERKRAWFATIAWSSKKHGWVVE